ncbi:hypothetical protein C4559_03400 [Candidatus Microgenomates bacterium]|nr:MAG: hypothetical protein C4559_03400 [Candidatus Microgenomates bacterium]
MRNKINLALKHPLISGSSMIFIGGLVASFFNFIFNLFMARTLLPSDYGILISIMSLLALCSLPAGAVIPLVINFAASYFAKKEISKVEDLFFKVLKFSSLLGLFVFIVFFIFHTKIAQFFRINNESLILLTGFMVFLGYIGVVNNALLQAKLSFKFITFSNLLGAFLKLAFGIGFVFLGFSVGGVIWGFLFASFIPYLVSFIPLKFIFSGKRKNSKTKIGTLLAYGAPAAITVFCLTSLSTIDLILVKHFFDPTVAGIYAGMATVGKVIFFFSAPIGTVMFPLIVQKNAKGENFHNIFKLSLLLVFIASVFITVFYFIYPEFTVKFFLKKEAYLSIAPLLGLFGIFITFYSLLSIIVNFYLSTKKTNVFIPIVLGAISQAALIWFFHSSFLQIISISISTTGLLVFALLLYYWRMYDKEKK